MELDLNKGRASRGIENPLSAIFDLADDVTEYSKYVKKMVWYAIIFMLFWSFFNILLILVTLGQGQAVLFIILLGILISGLFAIWLIVRTHIFFKYFTTRYNGIRTVRDSNGQVKIPEGSNVEERCFNYLRQKHPMLEALIKKNPKAVQHAVKLLGRSGKYYEFALFLSLPPSLMWKPFGLGQAGYGLFIKKCKGNPTMTEVLDVKNQIKDIAEAQDLCPSRIVMLYKFTKDFTGLGDDLYSFLTREEFKLELKGKTYYPVIQVIGELEDGYYDFTPLVPEFADRLP